MCIRDRPRPDPVRRLVIGITGATGALYAVRMLQALRGVDDVETHLVVSASGVLNICLLYTSRCV